MGDMPKETLFRSVSPNFRQKKRKIFQFVPISNFLVNNIVTTEHVMAALTKEVLAEVSYNNLFPSY